MAQPPVNVSTLRTMKAQREAIACLTAYDASLGYLVEQAGTDVVLVGDSLGMVIQGHDTTVPVTLDDLIPLTRGVASAVKRAFVVADMPFGSYETSADEALHTAFRFMKETGAHAVKLEGGVRSAEQIRRIVSAGIPVMAHIGFTPQSEHQLGGHVIQGRGESGIEALLADARAVEDAGAFAVVLEMVPNEAARRVTEELGIPTISVGAGPHCDGQLLVWTDWAGLTTGRIPKFVKQYANLAQVLGDAATAWRDDVTTGVYPAPEHSYDE
jgi:3-methyl-2-oxobutanoate hydroxymethyltransferase